MRKIIKVHYPVLEMDLLESAMNAFYALREQRGLQKKPSTSELIDWIRALQIGGISAEEICKTMPFAGVLLKKSEDMAELEKMKQTGRGPFAG